jgi:predicted methyltransferase
MNLLTSRRTLPLLTAALMSTLALPALAQPADASLVPALQAAVASGHRTVANVARDGWRHPVETLAFFGVKPTDTVVELSPGGGWYTEILAPYLRDRGQFIAAGDDPASSNNYARQGGLRFRAKLDATPGVYGKVKTTVFDVGGGKLDIAPPGSADVVLTFRNVHNWMAQGKAESVFAAAFTALKPGGVFGVVEHRKPVAQAFDPKAASGYVHEAHVIKLAEAAGFKLAGRSEVNANPKDPADHAGGVWSLPPVLGQGDKDRERYLAIGESDRMTLRFVKP